MYSKETQLIVMNIEWVQGRRRRTEEEGRRDDSLEILPGQHGIRTEPPQMSFILIGNDRVQG